MCAGKKGKDVGPDSDHETTAAVHLLRDWWSGNEDMWQKRGVPTDLQEILVQRKTHEVENYRAEGYKLAADRLVESVETHRDADRLVCPILSLYRHHIELYLKCVLTHPNLVRHGKVSGKWPSGHFLGTLWDEVKKVIAHKPSASIDRFFGMLTEWDKDGQGARYSRDTSNRQTLRKAPDMLGLKTFQSRVEEASTFLYGVQCDYDQQEDVESSCDY